MTQSPYRELLRYVRTRWLRWQCAVAALYFRRVTYPLQAWVACGRLEGFTPVLPWWQPFVWFYLVITGWARYFPRLHREPPV
jgi:hypothetical protein